MMAAEWLDAGPAPRPLTADTVKVTAVPLVSPEIDTDVDGADTVVAVRAVDPDQGVTTYEVIDDPLAAGAVHDTVAALADGIAAGVGGAAGTLPVEPIVMAP